MSYIDDPRVSPLQGGQAGGDLGDHSHYMWASLACSVAIISAIAVMTNAAPIYLSLLLVPLAFFILSGAGATRMADLSRASDRSLKTGRTGTGGGGAGSDSFNQSNLKPAENVGWRFQLEKMSIVVPCEGPPWPSATAGTTVTIPAVLERRFNGNGDPHTTSEENRLHLWGIMQVAASGRVSEKILFKSQNAETGAMYTLRQPWLSKVPLQQLHIGRGTIPDTLANTPCAGIDPLRTLNSIFQTGYSLATPGLNDCLQHFVQQSKDFGELYGFLRPWWYSDFCDVVQRVAARNIELEAIRRDAIRGFCIQNSRIPPRRVWDLRSNRVLPLHALPRKANSRPEDIPPNVWCVSHSWVDERDRVGVWTEINGGRWPVPIPCETTLDHVRIELLNMGAEYVWIDVLCLRQIGRDEDEMQRQEEWKLDVPTIGYTYSRPSTPCVIYFNGLGLPLDTSPAIVYSRRQWFNRVWTLQESPLSWLPGGLSARPLVDAHAFFDRLCGIVKAVNSRGDDSILGQVLRERSCTKEIDRISGLAYIFRCRTLPIYDENMSQDVAWTLLLKHMDAERRTAISLQYPPSSLFGLWGSWKTFLHFSETLHASEPRSLAGTSGDGSLRLVDQSQLYTNAQGVYFHSGYITESCYILLGGAAQAGAEEIEISCGDRENSVRLSILSRRGVLLDGMLYCLINDGEDVEHWILGEVVGEQVVEEEKALSVARWAVIRVHQDEGQRLEAQVATSRRRTRIVYSTAEEVVRQSSRVYEYIAAFNELAKLKSVGDLGAPSYYTLYTVHNKPDLRILLADTNPLCVTSDNRPTMTQIVIPEFVDQRIERGSSSADVNRTVIWGLIQLASSYGTASAHDLFQSSGRGKCYTLRPPTLSAVPLQWVHVGQGTIPDALADIPCDHLPIDDLLVKLNDVLGTSYPLETPGLRECLEYAISISRDFGEVYSVLRPQWSNRRPSDDFVTVLAKMKDRRDEDQRRRENAVRGHSIESRIPPRRVWDLYSNRVLPFHAVPWEDYEGSSCLPADLWTVSHSWVHERERELIITAINGRRWPVSLPRGTSLDHIRIELLNMGAKYVWLDILCMRQEGNVDDADVRLEEWRLDVPTVGHVYQAHPRGRPCITYFNGLGLPFDASPMVLEADEHWFNCLCTVQETLESWLPGGLTAAPLSDGPSFFSRLQDLISSMGSRDRFAEVIQAVNSRNCPAEHDKIAYLAYLLQCSTLPLPLYDQSASLEAAWTLLIKHMPSRIRTSLFLQHESNSLFGLWISWSELLATPPTWLLLNRTLETEELQLVDPQQVQTSKPGEYYHAAYATEPCYFVPSPDDAHRSSGPQVFQLHFDDRTDPVTVQISATKVHGHLVPNAPYCLLGVGYPWKDCWVAVEVVGERDVQGEKAFEVIKWGMIHMDEGEGQKFVGLRLGEENTRVVYLSGEEAFARSRHVDKYIAHTLSKHRAAVDVHEENGRTLLHFAARYGYNDIARTLLKHGAAVDARAVDGWTPLHMAARNGHVDIARTLLKRRAAVDAYNQNGATPLYIAAQRGHVNIVRTLLKRRAAVDAYNQNGATPLYIAAQRGHVNIVRTLLKRGAVVDVRKQDGRTPLHIAAKQGHVGIVRTLLKHGAAVGAQKQGGWTPLHITANQGHVDIARILLENGAAVGARNKIGWTPLHIASKKGHIDIGRTLLEHGAAVGMRVAFGGTPLHIAAQYGHVDVARTFLTHGAPVDAQDLYRETPLHIAARYGHVDIVYTLLKHGAAVNAQGRKGWTPLLYAASGGHTDASRVLLDNGADVAAMDTDGFRALDHTKARGRAEVVRLLLDHGADVHVENPPRDEPAARDVHGHHG